MAETKENPVISELWHTQVKVLATMPTLCLATMLQMQGYLDVRTRAGATVLSGLLIEASIKQYLIGHIGGRFLNFPKIIALKDKPSG